MQRATELRQQIQGALSPSHLEVHDESANHAVEPGAESHFRVVIVASAFEGKSRVARHKLVYEAVGNALRAGLHALAITSKTPAEWAADTAVIASPPCAGQNRS